MGKRIQKVVVIGHKNPDTDSICSAIAYAELKNILSSDEEYEARRAGHLNRESAFILEKFGVKPPRLCTDLSPKVRDVDYRVIQGVSADTSMRAAWLTMRDQNIDTLPIVDDEGYLLGVITVNDIATANMDVFDTTLLASSRTSYKNILETLGGTMLVGDENACVETGKLLIGAASPDVMEDAIDPGDIIILSNRYESQLCAIEAGVSAIIVCQGSAVSRTIQKLAAERGVAVISVPVDTYGAAKLISQSAPISHCMKRDGIIKFTLVTPVEDVMKIMGRVRIHYFPVLDTNGKYVGMLSRRNIINRTPRKLILLDHNESFLAVEGFETAEITEIIDHHRIGNIETKGPVYFRNKPVGSTATIVSRMYEENGIIPSPATAGLLLSAILSDTLMFRSPTCTEEDKAVAKTLENIAGLDMEELAAEMFEAGEKTDGKTAEELFHQDYKVFMCGDIKFGISQGIFMTEKNLESAKKLLETYLPEAEAKQNVEDIYIMLTDVPKNRCFVLSTGKNTNDALKYAFGDVLSEEGAVLDGVVSRKKQFLPKLMDAYQQL